MTARATACALLVAFGAVGAQSPRELTVEGGVLRAQQANRDSHDAIVLGLLWRESDVHFASLFSANASVSRDSAAAAQIIGAIAYRPSLQWPLQSEMGVSASRFGVTSLGRGGNLSGYFRQRVLIADGGIWGGGALGSTDRDNIASRGSTIDAGGWYRLGDFTATASIARTFTDDTPLMEAAGIFPLVDGADFSVDDASLAAHYEQHRLSLDAVLTMRNGRGQTLASQSAFFASATWDFTPRVSLALGGGHQLADPVRGTPDATVAQASVRFALRMPRNETEAKGVATFARLEPQDIGAVLTLTVTAPDSVTVEMAASFSDWQPLMLRRIVGGWELKVALKPGRYGVAVRFDGGAWQAPGSLAKIRDGFGGESGIVIIP